MGVATATATINRACGVWHPPSPPPVDRPGTKEDAIVAKKARTTRRIEDVKKLLDSEGGRRLYHISEENGYAIIVKAARERAELERLLLEYDVPERIVTLLIRFGRFAERVDQQRPICAAEHKRKVGRKAAEKANAAKSRKRPDYVSHVMELMATGMRYTPACEQVAHEFDVVPETVRNNSRVLWPRKAKQRPK
jgi:hypothetical protein